MSQPRTLPKPVNYRQDYKQKYQVSKEQEQEGVLEKLIPRLKLIFVFYENILIHSLLAGSSIFFNSKVGSFLSDGTESKLASHLLYLFGYIQIPFVILNLQSLVQHDKKNMKVNLPFLFSTSQLLLVDWYTLSVRMVET